MIDFQESRSLGSDLISKDPKQGEAEEESGQTDNPDPPSRLPLNLGESLASEAAPEVKMNSEREKGSWQDDPDIMEYN